MSNRRDELPDLERAVSDTLDELNHRMHGLTSSNAHPHEFLTFLAERQHVVVHEQLLTDIVNYLGDRSAGCGHIWDAIQQSLADASERRTEQL
ncbi:hypothetical protein [Streptosporangium sp. NPDC049078]|uniref:hypothetical protein n=1 Tax=Streptosporangium sp. NPDC049078 TaxID=3155767 RepID=UPI0034388628